MSADVVSVKEVDYLDEDKPIRGQNFVLLSFLSPEDVIVNKEAYMFSQFIEKFSKDMTTLLDGISAKYSDSKDFVDSVKENNAYIFNPKDMSEQYAFYKSVNNQELETTYHRDNNFTTSIRGIKVRGVFDRLRRRRIAVNSSRRLIISSISILRRWVAGVPGHRIRIAWRTKNMRRRN